MCSYECDKGSQVKNFGSFFSIKGFINSTAPSQLDKIPPWLKTTPFGLPEVPEV